ncbi:sensor histidine kinase [Thiorhodococcus minor]
MEATPLLAEGAQAMLRLEVRDDGRGFDPAVVREKKSFGLMGIRERVLIEGGSARIDSQPGEGTRLRITLPLSGEEETP